MGIGAFGIGHHDECGGCATEGHHPRLGPCDRIFEIMDTTERSTDNTKSEDLKWWDRFCTICGWRGCANELLVDEKAESFYRCPHCRIDSEKIQEVRWHRGDKEYRG